MDKNKDDGNQQENDGDQQSTNPCFSPTILSASSSEVGSIPTSIPQPAQQRPSVMPPEVVQSHGGSITSEFMMQMMKMMKSMTDRMNAPSEPKMKINEIFLPSYDPDTNVGVREWCQHVNQAVDTYKLNDYDVRMKVGSLLKGRAKLWVDDWMVTTSSWEELREKLITTFEPENRYPRDQEYVVVTIDAFSKYVLLHHATNKSQHSALGALKRTVHLFGTPNQIIVDGGREFLGDFKSYCDRYGIEIHSIAPGVSRGNGQVERVMATLKNALTMIKNYETERWHTTLDDLQLAMNCTTHRITGVAPLTLLTRRKHCVPPELLRLVNLEEETIDINGLDDMVQRRMATAAEQNKSRFDQHRAKIRSFSRGDYVLIKNNPRNQTSLDMKFSEPYEIFRVLDNDRYLVKRVVGRGRPRKVAHDQLRRAPQPGNQETVSAPDEDCSQPEVQNSAQPQEPVPSTSRADLPTA